MNDITQINALDLGKMIKTRKVSLEEVVSKQLEAIKSKEKDCNSYITIVEEEAYAQAKRVQKRIDNGELDFSPLAGVPVAIKDDICTKGIKTTAASRSLSNYVPAYNASVIEKLIEAGAIIIGKTNMDELAIGNSTETSYYGPTKNPCNLERVPGGSSGGSASAVAAGQAFYSLASDTGGSIRQPASYCGLVGIKPTYGTVSRYGLIPSASSLEQIGVMARNVADCAAALYTISGHDPKDSTSLKKDDYNYSEGLVGDLKNMRIGIPNIYLGEGLDKEVRTNFNNVIDAFREMGAHVEEFDLANLQYSIAAYYAIASAEFASNIARVDGVRYGYRAKDYKNLEDLYVDTRSEAFGIDVKKRILYGNLVLSADNYQAYFVKAQKVRSLIIESFTEAFDKYHIIMGPTCPNTAPLLNASQDNPLQKDLVNIYSVPVNLAGLPAISIPSGNDKKGLPIGLQLIGRPFAERDIIRAAHCFEEHYKSMRKEQKR